jgi:hypothetical protein
MGHTKIRCKKETAAPETFETDHDSLTVTKEGVTGGTEPYGSWLDEGAGDAGSGGEGGWPTTAGAW